MQVENLQESWKMDLRNLFTKKEITNIGIDTMQEIQDYSVEKRLFGKMAKLFG